MNDRTELKRLAKAANAVTGDVSVDIAISSERGPNQPEIDAVTAFVGAATPAAVLALIAENDEYKAVAEQPASLNASPAAEYEGLKRQFFALRNYALCKDKLSGYYSRELERLRGVDRSQSAGEIDAERDINEQLTNDLLAVEAERDQLKAENAGLRTGYEAYEQVNAELKAEVEGLRDDLDQVEYDANAWRNGEESVWIEVFNIEGDDPFICAISGKITVEQLALIQAEILEYREDYFEKGSGLYVFRCAHCQAHYDNVGMTEPAHWETDFESFSPFPWEEEAAALGQGEQS
ncbi:hypothetical protein JFT44_22275 [Pseudomonas sp. MF5691]|uniref:hypothetical protein n=1 Tax=Pseudomonas sp. MF5691 TaxID=2797526 RepID=UPI0018E7448D|nr:hypothetical protein [Pseudomonas sp. MF5691]MBJ2292648.1 hypothetical protein [Pseudomonas sp. MF5691]